MLTQQTANIYYTDTSKSDENTVFLFFYLKYDLSKFTS